MYLHMNKSKKQKIKNGMLIVFFAFLFCLGAPAKVEANETNNETEKVTFNEILENARKNPSFDKQWALYNQSYNILRGIDIRMPEALETYTEAKRKVIIAFIDSGTDYEHPDLQDAFWTNEDEIPDNGIDDDGNGYIDDIHGWNFYSDTSNVLPVNKKDNHGTYGAGIIKATANDFGIIGIAATVPEIKIMICKVHEGAHSYNSFREAIQYAEANGASICNITLGCEDEKTRVLMEQSNMLFVVGAGNYEADNDNPRFAFYPASYDLDNIISVASVSCNGELSYFSNYGITSVDLAAPGDYVLTTGSDGEYNYVSGTSFSAPQVSAVAAMRYAQYEDITLKQVRDDILSNVTHLPSLEGKVATGGMLNAYAILNAPYEPNKEDNAEQLEEQLLSTIKLEKDSVSLKSGKRTQIRLSKEIDPEKIINITYKSKEKNIAVVSKKGSIRAVAPGKTNIKVTVLLDDNTKKTFGFEVNVQ